MKTFYVYRNGKFQGEIEAETKEAAILTEQEGYCYEKFGQGGALTEKQVYEENEYFKGVFTAEEIN